AKRPSGSRSKRDERKVHVHHAMVVRGRRLAPCGLGLRALVLGLASLCLTLAPHTASAASGDPEPRVARVGFVEGEVSYLNADADEWTPVEVNAPLVTGDRFYSGPDGKAEIQL